jgi:hypothetical protein
MQNNESPLFTSESILQADLLQATVTVGRKVGGVLSYLSKRASQNSCDESSVSLMVDGMTVSQIPVDLSLRIVLRSLQGN